MKLLTTGKTQHSKHGTNDENVLPAVENKKDSDSSSEESEGETCSDHENNSSTCTEDSAENSEIEIDITSNTNPSDKTNETEDESEIEEESSENTNNTNKTPKRTRRPPQTWVGYRQFFAKQIILLPCEQLSTSDQPTIKESLENSSEIERKLWIEAIQEELNNLKNAKTWKKIPRKLRRRILRKIKKPIPTHLILKVKRNSNGQSYRFKARIVAGGNLQIKEEDFDVVYYPVIDFILVRVFLILAQEFISKSRHIDVIAAFLNGEVDRDIFVTHPVNLPKEFISSESTFYGVDGNSFVFILVYVDDLIFMAS